VRDNPTVGRKRRTRKKVEDWLGPYRRLRKKMPPPEKVIPDKRSKLKDEEAERRIEERE